MIKSKKVYYVLGLMSGTSLDGLDMALCSFKQGNKGWRYEIEKAVTISYSDNRRKQLFTAPYLSGEELTRLDHDFGRWIGNECKNFLNTCGMKPDLIASHGHTVFHQPEKGYTLQIGNGNEIAAVTGIPVVYDFRNLDVALGGKGAPLVPVGDELLFPEYDGCLNLGGFANISYKSGNNRIAFDICPVNIILNHLAEIEGKLYDEDGSMGKRGKIIEELLLQLNELPFYRLHPPRTLMREWMDAEFIPALKGNWVVYDLARTVYEHITDQISGVIKLRIEEKILITGGGAKNPFLISLLQSKCNKNQNLIIPATILIDFKEALIFGFLGLLRYLNKTNCFCTVTGASHNSSTGVVTGIIDIVESVG